MLTATKTYTGKDLLIDKQLGTRMWKKLVKKANLFAGGKWHSNFRAKHFTEAGAREYRYASRKGQHASPGSKAFKNAYQGRKRREKQHTKPLVWSGRSEFLSRQRSFKATSKRVRISIRAPALNLKPKTKDGSTSKVNMRKEMETVSGKELRALDRQHGIALNRFIKSAKGHKIKRFR